jgi:hypothetical protein
MSSFNYKTVIGQSAYKPWKNWSEGDYLVGKYVSETVDTFGNPNYKVEVIEAQFDDGNIPKPNTIFTFNSSGTLKKAMESISVGDVFKVIYKGEDTVAKGKFKGKKYHSMEVLVADKKTENTDSDLI